MFFLVSDQRHYTFLYGYAKHNREDGKKEQRNKHGLRLAPSAIRGGVSVTLLWSAPCTKLLGMLTHLLTALVPSSRCPLLLTVSFSGQLSQANCSLLPSFVNICLFWDLPSLLHFRSRKRFRPQALCACFSSNNTKRFSDRRQHNRK